jgi:serine/threonine protein kinase
MAHLLLALHVPVCSAGFSWDVDNYLFCGTVDYSSVRTLFGRHPTPKDDLEGLACTLLEMATGEHYRHG